MLKIILCKIVPSRIWAEILSDRCGVATFFLICDLPSTLVKAAILGGAGSNAVRRGAPRGALGGAPRGAPRGALGGAPRGALGEAPRGALGGAPRGVLGAVGRSFHSGELNLCA